MQITGKKYEKNENSAPVFSPKSLRICVNPKIPSIEIHTAEKILYAIILPSILEFVIK